MAHRQPRPDPRLPKRPSAQPQDQDDLRRSDPSSAESRDGRNAEEASDFMGLDMELRAGTRRTPAPEPAADNLAPAPADQGWVPIPPPPRIPRTMPDAPPGAPPMVVLMQPQGSDVRMARDTSPTVRTNSWLLDSENARRAAQETESANNLRIRRQVQAPRPLEMSFREPAPASRRTMPWLVGLLLFSAGASLVYVVSTTLDSSETGPLSKAHLSRTTAPLVPDVRAPANSELSDPFDARPIAPRPAKTHDVAGSRPRPGQAHVPAPTGQFAPSSAIERPATRPAASSAAPSSFPVGEIPPPDVLTLPGSGPEAAPATSPSGSPEDAPQSAAAYASFTVQPDIAIATWWPGAVRAAPLATSESGPADGELAASEARRARVAQWLMERSRSAAPEQDASATYSPAADTAPALPAAEPSARHDAPDPIGSEALVADRVAEEPVHSAPIDTPPIDAVPIDVVPSSAPRADATASAGLASVLWEGSTVPVDRIESNVRLLTPQVGRVRAALRSGEAIEGALYAVGSGRVWIDAEIGRIALGRGEITRLEQIATPLVEPAPEPVVEAALPVPAPAPVEAAPVTSGPVTPVPEPPPRVRVRTPGGLFFGQVIAREGATITLLTDEGSRVTLESTDVELAPISKATVKRPPAPAKKPAPTPAPAPAPADATPHRP